MAPRPPDLRVRSWRRGPDLLAARFADVSPDFLRSLGREAVLLDVDGTLGPHGLSEPPPDAVRWVADLRAAGIAAAVVSNAGARRMARYCGVLGVPYAARAGKPSPKAVRRILDRLGVPAGRAVLVGDQLYTDVAAARAAGVLSVLVRPVPSREPVQVVLKRLLERAALRRALGPDGMRRFLSRG